MGYKFRMATILVPLDTSEIASKVLLEAESLALKLEAKVILFHVVEPVATYVPAGAAMDLIATSPPELDDEQTDVALGRLEQLAAPLRAKGLEVATTLAELLPVLDDIGRARDHGDRRDGFDGRDGFDRWRRFDGRLERGGRPSGKRDDIGQHDDHPVAHRRHGNNQVFRQPGQLRSKLKQLKTACQ